MSIDEFIRLFRRRLSKKKNNKDKRRRANSVDITSKDILKSPGNQKISTSTVNLENPFTNPPNTVQIEYRRESEPQLLVLQNMNISESDDVKPFKRNPSKKKSLKHENSLNRPGFTTTATQVSIDEPIVWKKQENIIEKSSEIEDIEKPLPMEEVETVWRKTTHKVYEISPVKSLQNNVNSTYFPVHIQDEDEYTLEKEREQIKSPATESGYASGRISGLELSMPSSQNNSTFNSPISSSNLTKRKSLIEAPKSMEALNDPKSYAVPIVLETSFDDNDIENERIIKNDLLKQYQRNHIKSEIQIRPSYRSKSVDSAVKYLQRKVKETKYITAVFESAKGGLAEMIDDVTKEFKLWLGEKSSLLGVAVEMHWSVPEKLRSRANEIRLKDELHKELRQNNMRVLNLYEGCRNNLPSNFIESKTEENCSRNKNVSAFQGIYRRYYPELLALQDKKTIKSHSQYWTFDNDSTYSLPVPNPKKFLFHGVEDILSERTIVALNLATIRLDESK